MTDPALYFEDMVPGRRIEGASATVSKQEIVDFATAWDPLDIHIDEAAGKAAFGSLTAAGLHILAIKQRLIHETAFNGSGVIASLGYDELRFLKPVRPGDRLSLEMECVEARASKSRPGTGIATVRLWLENQDGETVMSHLDTVMMRFRNPPDGG